MRGKHLVWDVNAAGVITKGSGWKTTAQAVNAGWESTFGDMNGDSIIGPNVVDKDKDGFVDGVSNYQIYSSGSAIQLRDRKNRRYSDGSTPNWDAVKAVSKGSGYQVLLEGASRLRGKHFVWDVNAAGVITKGSGWKTTAQAVNAGWESLFGFDINGDSAIV